MNVNVIREEGGIVLILLDDCGTGTEICRRYMPYREAAALGNWLLSEACIAMNDVEDGTKWPDIPFEVSPAGVTHVC
jgi:hypothetical protein